MHRIPIQIVRFVEDYFPGIVECAFIDASGREHRFIEKAPVVSAGCLNESATYPQPGQIACEILESWRGVDGRVLARVTTERPWGIESTEGQSEFVVVAEVLQA
jgi:hypothetical protein